MCKDYFKRLTVVRYTVWDLNCHEVVHHSENRKKIEKAIRRHARRKDKEFLKRGVDIACPV